MDVSVKEAVVVARSVDNRAKFEGDRFELYRDCGIVYAPY
jgi:hypothetical protein